ncbi:hypothetical protein [Thermocatellispora tengchongensis]|uniref:hypothetical protein n=1 Tax=Thermocatellispora tengchongensis TaxID=1073253 RepID=UPI003632C1E8
MAHHAGERLHAAEAEQHQRPHRQGAGVLADQRVDRLADHGRHERLPQPPQHGEEHAAGEGCGLLAGHPVQVANGPA